MIVEKYDMWVTLDYTYETVSFKSKEHLVYSNSQDCWISWWIALSNMKVCLILLASLILVSLAQKMDPVECDWEKEWMCPGEWNEDKQPISPDYCIPIKVGDCYNYCPVGDWYCSKDGEDRMFCPGNIDINGCEELGYCYPGSK